LARPWPLRYSYTATPFRYFGQSIDGIFGLAVCDLLRTVSVIITVSIARTSASYAARGSNTATLARCWAHEGPLPPAANKLLEMSDVLLANELSIWLCLTIGKKAGMPTLPRSRYCTTRLRIKEDSERRNGPLINNSPILEIDTFETCMRPRGSSAHRAGARNDDQARGQYGEALPIDLYWLSAVR